MLASFVVVGGREEDGGRGPGVQVMCHLKIRFSSRIIFRSKTYYHDVDRISPRDRTYQTPVSPALLLLAFSTFNNYKIRQSFVTEPGHPRR